MRSRPLLTVTAILFVVSLLAAWPASAQPAGGTASAQPAAAIDRGYIPPDAVLAAVAHPRRVLTAPEMEFLPIEIISAAGLKELGLDPVQIEEVLAVAEIRDFKQPPQFGLVLRFAQPLRQRGLLPALVKDTTPAEIDGKPYRKGIRPDDVSLMRADERTILVSNDDLLHKMLANVASPQPGPAAKLLGQVPGSPDAVAVLALDPIRPILKAELQKAPVPPAFAGFLTIPDLVISAEVQLSLLGNGGGSLVLRARDEAAAQQLEAMLNALLDMGKMGLQIQAGQMAKSPDPVEQATGQYMQRASGRMLDMLRPVREGDHLSLSGKGASAQVNIATTGVLVGLLLPAVQAAREAARRAQSLNNLHQISLAMHNHLASFNTFPPRAICDKQGKPLLSWRVQVLPYLDQDALYRAFHLDEPWDSEHNKKLIAAMPAIYRNPSSAAPPGMANYLAVSGKGLMFDGAEGRKLAEITDGMANTIMVVEANDDRAVTWTKPEDWQCDPQRPLAGLGSAHPGGFGAAFADGSVHFIAKSIDPKTFYALLTIAGGEAVNPNAILGR
jgi:hypothetical protein